MKTKTQFKQEMRKYFKEQVTKKEGETFLSWFDGLWKNLEAEGKVEKISGTSYLKIDDAQMPEPKTDGALELKDSIKAAMTNEQAEVEIDLRDFKEAVRRAIAEEKETDENWSWSIKAINKFRIKIGWGYTDYLEEKNPFSIRVEAGVVENPVVIGELPNSQKVIAFVGDKIWDDYKSYEEAVVGVIHSMAATARNIY